MTKKLSISMSDFVYDTYIADINKNRSEYIEKLIIIGSDSVLNNEKTNKAELIKLIQEKQNLERDLRQARLTIENLKIDRNNDGMSEDGVRNTKMAKAIKNSGFMRRL